MTEKIKGILSIVLLLIINGSVNAQTEKNNLVIIKTLDSVLKKYNDNSPGVAVNIVKDGKQVYNKAFGMADLERGSYLSTESVFEVASVSKQFTATAILLLVAEGKLSLEDDVHTYVPRLPDYGKPIKIKHLLTHTSGLRDWRNVTYLTEYVNYTREYNQGDALNIICRQEKLNFESGYKYSYSNSNYDLLAAVVEKVTGETFASFATKRLLEPVGMTNTQWRNDYRDVIKNRALSYIGKKGSYKLLSPLDNTNGAAGLLSTPTDLQKWNMFWRNNGFGDTVAKLRLQQGILNNGRQISYAMGGVNVIDRNGIKLITHGGLLTAYRTLTSYYPELDLSITYCANTRDIIAPGLVSDILAIYRPRGAKSKSNFLAMSADEMNKKIGVYKNTEAQNVFSIEMRKDTAALRFKNGGTLKALSKDTLISDDEVFTFVDKGIEVADEDGFVLYKPVQSYQPAVKELNSFTGKYYSREADAEIVIEVKDGKLRYSRNGYEWLSLTPSFQDGNIKGFSTIDNGLFALFEFGKTNKKEIIVSVPRALNITFREKK